MTEESLLLERDFHKEYICSILEESVKKKEFADVVLVSDDLIPFKVHKFVLSAYSPVMTEILSSHAHSCPLIFLRNVKSEELQALVYLLYFGEARLNPKHF